MSTDKLSGQGSESTEDQQGRPDNQQAFEQQPQTPGSLEKPQRTGKGVKIGGTIGTIINGFMGAIIGGVIGGIIGAVLGGVMGFEGFIGGGIGLIIGVVIGEIIAQRRKLDKAN